MKFYNLFLNGRIRLSLLYAICFSFIIQLFIHLLNVNSDYENYILEFSLAADVPLLSSIKSNTLVIYIFNILFSPVFGNPQFLASLLYFVQSFFHSFIFTFVLGPLYASLLLFSDFQQIDLNQARFGLSLDLILFIFLFTSITGGGSIHTYNSNIKAKVLPLSNSKLVILFISSLLHFQAILFSIYLFCLRVPLLISLSFVTIFGSFLPYLINLAGITARYINEPIVERVLPLNIFLYAPSCLLISFIINSISISRQKFLIFGHLKLITIPKNKIYCLKGILPLGLFIVIFFNVSSSPVYEGRLLTGLFSTLIYMLVLILGSTYNDLHLSRQFLSSNGLLLMTLFCIGVYRFITLFGSIYTVI